MKKEIKNQNKMNGRNININLGNYVDLNRIKYKALQNEIMKLYTELEVIKPMENNTMRREKIVGMIERLEKLSLNYKDAKITTLWDEDSKNVLIEGNDFTLQSVENDECGSRVIVNSEGIDCKVFEKAKRELLTDASEYVDGTITYMGYVCGLCFKRHEYDKFKLDNGELIKGQEIVFRDKIYKIVEVPGYMGFEFEIRVELVRE
ncbi:MAG: hypothetical protein ACRCX8_18885 [Sarcina sp.]